MKLSFHSLWQIAALVLYCLLLRVAEVENTFVPGRCECPQAETTLREPISDLTVRLKGPGCHRDEIKVVLKRNKQVVCLSPEGPLGKQLMRCWNRVSQKGLSVKRCLRKRKVKGSRHGKQRGQNGKRGHSTTPRDP